MFESHSFTSRRLEVRYCTRVRETGNLPDVLEFWMAHVARDVLRLGVFFRAAALLQQLPGGARYRYLSHDDLNEDLPDDDDDPWNRVRRSDRDTVFNVLRECLRRLGSASVMKQIPGSADYERAELTTEWKDYLGRRAKAKNGLLNIVAECLDELIVRPGMKEIDNQPSATWWQCWWSRMLE